MVSNLQIREHGRPFSLLVLTVFLSVLCRDLSFLWLGLFLGSFCFSFVWVLGFGGHSGLVVVVLGC